MGEFEGHGGGGEHRTTGERAWCYDCREWCYPEDPCGQRHCCAEKVGIRPELEDGVEVLIDGDRYIITDIDFDLTRVSYVLPVPHAVMLLRPITKEET